VAGTRKLGKPTDQRLAMLKTQTTDLLLNGKITTTEARAKEVKSIVDSIIALAIKEKNNYEEVEVKVVKAKLDNKGHKVTEKVTSKNGKEYLKVVKEEKMEKRQKDMPSRLNARRKIMKKVNKVEGTDLMAKLFGEIASKYEGRQGGYTRMLKCENRKGDNAVEVILELVKNNILYNRWWKVKDLTNLFVILIAIYGWYIFIKDVLNTYIYKKIKFDNNIKMKIIIKDQEENIEMLIKKIKSEFDEVKDLEIIDDNSQDKTYEILTKIQKKNHNINIRKINEIL